MHKKALKIWAFLTPAMLAFSGAVLESAALNVLAIVAIPLVLRVIPKARNRECLWGVLLIFVSFIPTNINLVWKVLALYGINFTEVANGAVLYLAMTNFEVLIGSIILRFLFPQQIRTVMARIP